MRLKRTGKLLKPFDDRDVKLFNHITHGSCSITEDYLYELREVFIAHGIIKIEIHDEVIQL